jgi:hypothetical protein
MKLNAFLVVLPLMFRFVAAEKEAVRSAKKRTPF